MSEQKKWETKPNTGSAFVNKRKQKDTHPDYTGEILVTEPGLHWFNIWVKETKDGQPWFSVSVSPKEERGATASLKVEVKPTPVAAPINDDSVPF